MYCSVSAPSPVKEQKQVRVYQWHSLVPYFNNNDNKTSAVHAVPPQGLGIETKAAKKIVTLPPNTLPPKRPVAKAIHESISENSK